MKSKIIAIIPVRMGSSRFYGKPLKLIHGISMVNRIFKIVSKSKVIEKVLIATPDKIIFDHVKKFGGIPVMTSNKHKRASDRCSEALKKFEKKIKKKYEIVVMVQGDEPMINHKMISNAIRPLIKDKTTHISNVCSRIKKQSDFKNKNTIKVVFNKKNDALYFSREPIPNQKIFKKAYKQVCIIPFRRKFLYDYSKLKPTELEIRESIDMNRILEYGKTVKLVFSNKETYPVDTLNDLIKVRKITNKI